MDENDYKCMNCKYFNRVDHTCRYWEPGCFYTDDDNEDDLDDGFIAKYDTEE